jgi:hypothetical protein
VGRIRVTEWRAAAFIVLASGAVVLTLAYALLIIETPVTYYATYADAAAAGEMARRWIPSWLPTGAHDIREAHDIDTNERWLSLRAPVAELRSLADRLERLAFQDARRTAFVRSWRAGRGWPSELSERLWVTPRGPKFMGYFRSRDDAYCLAIEWQTGRAWGWSCRIGP